MQAINYDVKLFSFSFFLSFFSTKDDIYQKNKNKKENPKKSDRIASCTKQLWNKNMYKIYNNV